VGRRAKAKGRARAERHSLAELIQEGRTDLVEAVMRGEVTASKALNQDRAAKRQARQKARNE
jgi:hypothetical protein